MSDISLPELAIRLAIRLAITISRKEIKKVSRNHGALPAIINATPVWTPGEKLLKGILVNC